MIRLTQWENHTQIVHKKNASVLCLTTVKNEDKLEFSKILEAIKV
jgi:large subunit ribosomal protein L7Ae